jgi:hypothetical protein
VRFPRDSAVHSAGGSLFARKNPENLPRYGTEIHKKPAAQLLFADPTQHLSPMLEIAQYEIAISIPFWAGCGQAVGLTRES